MANPYAAEMFDPTAFEVAVLRRLDRIIELMEKAQAPVEIR